MDNGVQEAHGILVPKWIINVTGKRSIGEGSEMQTSMIEKKKISSFWLELKKQGMAWIILTMELHRITNCIEGMRCCYISYHEKHLTHRRKMDLEKA